MDRRTHEGPMDFEYQNGTGPMDGRSPFAQISMNPQRNNSDTSAKKRGMWTAFGSPGKSTVPSLREPASQPHLFAQTNASSSSKPLPPTPWSMRNNPLFSTPRKLDVDLASSGGETPKSPQRDPVDSDATPDHMSMRSVVTNSDQASMPAFTAGSIAPPKKEKERRRDSWWNRATGFVSSPGRGEVARGVYSDKIVKRVRKKRSRDAHRQLERIRKDSLSDSEMDGVEIRRVRKTSGSRAKAQEPVEQKGPHFLYSFFEFLEKHPALPHVLSYYAQLMLNTFIVSFIIYIIWSFWATIRSDVDKKSSEAISELLAEMAVCAQQYTENRCARDTRVPAMEVVCNNWDKCMNRDTQSVGRARVSAHTFAEIFNSFLEPISYKAMIFSLLLVFGCVALSNLPFSMFRNKTAAANAAAAANHHHYYPPPTPQRQFSGPEGGFWAPYHDQQAGLEPAPSDFPQIEGRSSPVKQLQFR